MTGTTTAPSIDFQKGLSDWYSENTEGAHYYDGDDAVDEEGHRGVSRWRRRMWWDDYYYCDDDDDYYFVVDHCLYFWMEMDGGHSLFDVSIMIIRM